MILDNFFLGNYELSVFIKLLVAALAGAAVGFEREKHGRPAGLRTHLLVAVGSCLIMVVSEAFFLKYDYLTADSAMRIDPARTAAQIVTGIGFLGAGVIIKEGLSVRGLTTAASLWVVSGLGMAFGMGLFLPGFFGTMIVLFSLFFLKKLEPNLKKDRYLCLTVIARQRESLFDELERIILGRHLRISEFSSSLDLASGDVAFEFVITQQKRRIGRELTAEMARLEGIKKISFR
jgi:putative Mg2+ transporter-C (MgtC) family protein